jgi:hypothetical protein
VLRVVRDLKSWVALGADGTSQAGRENARQHGLRHDAAKCKTAMIPEHDGRLSTFGRRDVTGGFLAARCLGLFRGGWRAFLRIL